MDDDLSEIRSLFPVTEHWTYLYNGSIHPQPRPVVEAMTAHIQAWADGGEAAYPSGMEAFSELRDRLARLIGGKASNIVVTESTTSALNLAAAIVDPGEGQNVVLDDMAFMTNTHPWLNSRMAIPDVRFVPERDGAILVEDIAGTIDERTALLSISAVTVGNGFRFDLGAMSRLASATGVPVLVDGAQAVGVVPVDLHRTPVDFLAGTASKWLMGVAGVGYLHVADEYLAATPPTTGWFSAANVADWDSRLGVLHEDAMRFQGGIPNFIGIVGTAAALRFREEIGVDVIMDRVRERVTYLVGELGDMGADVWTPPSEELRAGIVFFRSERAAEINDRLRAERIYCGSFLGGVRCDPSFYNTKAELDRFLAVVRDYH